MLNGIAQYRAWKNGVVHTTFNPEKPGAVRIHLIPPKWKPFNRAPYTIILNGYWVLPIGYSWAILLGNFIEEVNRFEERTMNEKAIKRAAARATEKTKKTYIFASKQKIRYDLDDILSVLFDIAHGKTPETPIGTLSIREYAPHMSAPHRMDLMVSSMTDKNGAWNCNLKCRNCYAAGQKKAISCELSTEEWKRIIDKCREVGIPQLTFTGGEPTLRDDLVELIEYARWHVTRLNTNGILLTDELCKKLKEASLDAVQITLYSYDKDIHNNLVGKEGAWDETIKGIYNAVSEGLNVSVNTPLCDENKKYTKTLKLLKKLGVQYVTCSGLIETGNAKTKSQLSVESIDEILRDAAEFCKENDMELSFTSPGRASVEVLKELGLTVPMCGACLSNMAIAPDGCVMPCQSWLSENSSLGNMLTDNWKKIWNNKKCSSIRGMSEEESLQCPLRKNKKEGK